METYHLPSLYSQHPKYPESKTKITFYPNSTLSDIPSHARHSSWWINFSGNFKVNGLLPFVNFPATRINHSLIVFTSHRCTVPPVSKALPFTHKNINRSSGETLHTWVVIENNRSTLTDVQEAGRRSGQGNRQSLLPIPVFTRTSLTIDPKQRGRLMLFF